MRIFFLCFTLLILVLACSQAPLKTEEALSCDILVGLYEDEMRDQLLVQACIFEGLNACHPESIPCRRELPLKCVEQHLRTKANQLQAIRERQCFSLDLDEESM